MNSFDKRKETVMKKAFQLSVLCGVPVAAIVFSPYGKVETYPENLSQLKSMLKQTYYDDDDESSKEHSPLMYKLNQLDTKIAEVDRMMEVMMINNGYSFDGVGFQALLAGPQNWFAPFGSGGCGGGGGGPFHGQGFGWLQSIGPNSFAVVDNMLPLQPPQTLAAVDDSSYNAATTSAATAATTTTTTTTTLLDGGGGETSESYRFAEEEDDMWCDIINTQEDDYLQSRLCFGGEDDFSDNHGEVGAFAGAVADEDGDEIFNLVNNFFNAEVVNT